MSQEYTHFNYNYQQIIIIQFLKFLFLNLTVKTWPLYIDCSLVPRLSLIAQEGEERAWYTLIAISRESGDMATLPVEIRLPANCKSLMACTVPAVMLVTYHNYVCYLHELAQRQLWNAMINVS